MTVHVFIYEPRTSGVVYDIARMRRQKVWHLTLVFRGVFSVFCLFVGIFSVVIDTATNEVINIMFGKPQETLGDHKGFFFKF